MRERAELLQKEIGKQALARCERVSAEIGDALRCQHLLVDEEVARGVAGAATQNRVRRIADNLWFPAAADGVLASK